jgi:hypothetical protein
LHDSANSYYPFTLIDTPGTNSEDEKFKNTIFLTEAFTCLPINAIFVIIQNHPSRPN